jgi:hypothetical protein
VVADRMINIDLAEAILLTGAGFTHNFGGFLARTMWAEIHNRIQQSNNARLIALLKENFDYEDLYQQVLADESYSAEEKSVFVDAVCKAYEALEGVVRDYNDRYLNTTFIDLDNVNGLISRFAGDQRRNGFFFTLNQDLFVERYYSSISTKLVHPGVRVNYTRFTISRGKALEDQDLVTVPGKEELENRKLELRSLGDFYYVKLHGSCDWRDSKNQKRLVIGLAKEEQVPTEPILSWYYQLFKEVLSHPGRRLLIIGYGFRDPHINEVLANSVKDFGLRLFIINPVDPETFWNGVLKNTGSHRETIWEGVAGYYPYSFYEFFPYGGAMTQHYKGLLANLFGS